MAKTMSALLVMIVEDDAVIGVLLAETLEAMGHTVCGGGFKFRSEHARFDRMG